MAFISCIMCAVIGFLLGMLVKTDHEVISTLVAMLVDQEVSKQVAKKKKDTEKSSINTTA